MLQSILQNTLRRASAGPSRLPLSLGRTQAQRRHLSQRAHRADPFPFKPPPIRQRLKPLIPFFIYWSLITSLAVHLLRLRISTEEEMDQRRAQITVLSSLIERIGRGETVDLEEGEGRKELEMVGLRERRTTQKEGEEGRKAADVGWGEVLFGRKRERGQVDERKEAEVIEEWAQVINQATDPSHSPSPSTSTSPASTPLSSSSSPPLPKHETRRAPSSNVYM